MIKLFTPLSNKTLPIVIAILLFLLLNPYYTWWLNASPLYRILLNFTIPLLFFFSKEKKDKGTPIILYLIATFLYVFLGFVMGRFSIIGSISASICFLFSFVFWANRALLFDVFEQLINILFVVLGLAVVAWIFYLLGIISPMGTVSPPTMPSLSYTVYPFFIISNDLMMNNVIIRFSGPFNEPGVVGTLVVLILVVKKYNLKDIRLVTLFIAGLLSLSLAFYLISVFFCLFYLAIVKHKIVPVCLIIVFLGLFYWQTKDDPILSSTIYERVKWNDETGSISGDNRSNDMVDAYYNKTKGTFAYYFGTNDPDWYNHVAGGESSSYKNVICINGVITVVLYLLFLIQLGWVNKRNLSGFILYIAVLFMNFYQRSSLFSLPVLFLYCCMAKADKQ